MFNWFAKWFKKKHTEPDIVYFTPEFKESIKRNMSLMSTGKHLELPVTGSRPIFFSDYNVKYTDSGLSLNPGSCVPAVIAEYTDFHYGFDREFLLSLFRQTAEIRCKENGTVTIDDVWSHGPGMAEMSRVVFQSPIFEWTGEWKKSTRKSNRGRKVKVWRLKSTPFKLSEPAPKIEGYDWKGHN